MFKKGKILCIAVLATVTVLATTPAFAAQSVNIAMEKQAAVQHSPSVVFKSNEIKEKVSQRYIDQLKKQFPNAGVITILDAGNQANNKVHQNAQARGTVHTDAWYDWSVTNTWEYWDIAGIDQMEGFRYPIITVAKGQTLTLTSSQTYTATTEYSTEYGANVTNVVNVKASGKESGQISKTYTVTQQFTGPGDSSPYSSRTFYTQAIYDNWSFQYSSYGYPSGDYLGTYSGNVLVPRWIMFSIDN